MIYIYISRCIGVWYLSTRRRAVEDSTAPLIGGLFIFVLCLRFDIFFGPSRHKQIAQSEKSTFKETRILQRKIPSPQDILANHDLTPNKNSVQLNLPRHNFHLNPPITSHTHALRAARSALSVAFGLVGTPAGVSSAR